MQSFNKRFHYLFHSTKGLILVAIALLSLAVALFGMLSGPMADWGVKVVVVRILGMKLVQAEREGRLVILYHTIAMAVIAIETYMITGLLQMKENQRGAINATITAGYLAAMFGGLPFAYWGHNWIFHGIYISGLVLMFFSGCMLAAALWPWRQEYKVASPEYAHTRTGYDLERIAFFVMALTTMISALFGAIPGSYFGNGFEAFLAENVVREPEKMVLNLSVIGHLHIMLALIAIACALIVGRWMDFRGVLQKMAMPLMIAGSFVLAMGTWLVVPFEATAHYIIYGGSTLAMLGALFMVIHSWRELILEGLARKGLVKGDILQSLAALVGDPLKFGATWQMVFMNFTVSGVGIFVAVRLDEIFRQWQFTDERSILTGHWHILATLTATILLLYYADLAGLKGKVRQWFGWLVIIFSDLAFGSVTVYELRRLFVSEAGQQPLINATTLLGDIGLGTFLVVLAALMVWRLVDLFRKKGRWTKESGERLDAKAEVER